MEKKKVLEMLAEGKITVDEAERLLNALKRGESPKAGKGGGKRLLKILVNSKDGDTVNIAIPISLAKIALSMVPDSVMEELEEDSDFDLRRFLEHLDDLLSEMKDFEGDIVNVESADGDSVRIFLV